MTQIEAHETWWQRWGVRLLPAVTFLVGLGLGAAVTIGAGGGGSSEEAGGDASTSPSSSSTSSNGPTTITLPAACEDAAENITEATQLLDRAVGSVRDFAPDQLIDVLNRLEDLDEQTRPLARECSQVDVSESPAPTASPSASE